MTFTSRKRVSCKHGISFDWTSECHCLQISSYLEANETRKGLERQTKITQSKVRLAMFTFWTQIRLVQETFLYISVSHCSMSSVLKARVFKEAFLEAFSKLKK